MGERQKCSNEIREWEFEENAKIIETVATTRNNNHNDGTNNKIH